jgi:serine phosphatase RsbU (regulator of sigma subunit)
VGPSEENPDPRRPFAVVVGDVSGHDVYAAAAMGQLKGLVQATATLQHLMPAAVLSHIDRLLPALNDQPPVATMMFAHLEPLATGDWLLTISSAGHPAPLIVKPDATAEFFDPEKARGPLLGFGTPKRAEASQVVPAGSTLLAYTDGLFERRGEILDDGLDRLRDAAAQAVLDGPGVTDGPAVTDQIVAALMRDHTPDDDIVVIAVQLH